MPNHHCCRYQELAPRPKGRRSFLKAVAAAGAVTPFLDRLQADQTRRTAGDRLNVGVVGVGGFGAVSLAAVAQENVVALCDVDLTHLGDARRVFPKAAVYQDFRRLMEHRGLDAVVVATPDHTHAVVAVMALRMGLHVYCEAPLAHTVHEAKVLREEAARARTATQTGFLLHAENAARRGVEVVKSGLLGPIHRVDVWVDRRPEPGRRVAEGAPPATLDYDAWLGPAPRRPYDPSHVHHQWRWWWDFGGGVLADAGSPWFDLVFRSLDLEAP
ncbi:MAG: Gfo/Idh/MocA family protein, partial [Planctomycetia bacterium]